MAFAAWLKFPSVIPICFESLVSGERGGSDIILRQTIWNLILKLKISTSVNNIIQSVEKERQSSETLNKGTAGRYLKEIDEKTHQKIAADTSDYMRVFGYGRLWSDNFEKFTSYLDDCHYVSEFDEIFQKRTLQLVQNKNNSQPLLIESVEDFNIILFETEYYIVPQGRPINFEQLKSLDYPYRSAHLLFLYNMLSTDKNLIKLWPP